MPLSIRCPRGHKLNVPSKYAGQTVRCPACQSRIIVPGELAAVSKEVKEEATKLSPPKLPEKKQPATTAKEIEPVEKQPAEAEKVTASIEAEQVSPPVEETPPVEVPAPPPFEPAEKEAQPAAASVAFSPEDPAQQVPMGGIVPGANRQSSLARFLRGRKLLTSDLGYRPELSKKHSIYWLAGTQFILALFAMVPGVWQMSQPQSAPWAHVVLLLSLVQMGYAVWLALVPDYSSAEVGMFATGGLAAIYAAAMAVCWLSAPRIGGWLQLGSLKMEYGTKPALWCAVMVLLGSLTAYLCGHVSFRWRKAYRQTVLGMK